jgi:hypothetical protein
MLFWGKLILCFLFCRPNDHLKSSKINMEIFKLEIFKLEIYKNYMTLGVFFHHEQNMKEKMATLPNDVVNMKKKMTTLPNDVVNIVKEYASDRVIKDGKLAVLYMAKHGGGWRSSYSRFDPDWVNLVISNKNRSISLKELNEIFFNEFEEFEEFTHYRGTDLSLRWSHDDYREIIDCNIENCKKKSHIRPSSFMEEVSCTRVCWVPLGKQWKVTEYDGLESVKWNNTDTIWEGGRWNEYHVAEDPLNPKLNKQIEINNGLNHVKKGISDFIKSVGENEYNIVSSKILDSLSKLQELLEN